MGRRRKSLLLVSVALAFWIPSVSAEQLPLKTYTTADGLASDLVRCILSDSQGFLWLGTADGISRFDGYVFTNMNAADGLPGTDVHSITHNPAGPFWPPTAAALLRRVAAW